LSEISIEKELPVVADTVLFDDLHHQAALALDHQRRRVPAGDHVWPQPAVQKGAAFVERQLPEALPGRHRFAGQDVHEHVQPLLLFAHAREERRDLRVHGVVDAHRDPDTAGGGHQFRRLFDGFGASGVVVIGGVRTIAAATSGTVDGRAPFAEHPGNPAPRPASGAGDYGNMSFERLHQASSPYVVSASRRTLTVRLKPDTTSEKTGRDCK
jgi:hypothetical protein